MSLTRMFAISAYCTLISYAVAVHFLGWELGDKGWNLMIAYSWLNGEQLYVDKAEVSLPLIYLLYAAVIKAAAVMNMPDYHVLTLATMLLAALVSYLVYTMFVKYSTQSAHTDRLTFLLLLSTVFILWAGPGYFGDREHLIVMLIFPYLYLFSPTVEREKLPVRYRASLALIAALGFCIKPHAVIFLALVLLLMAVRQKSLRVAFETENLFIYGVGLLYLVYVGLMFPAYFREILPMAALTYDAAKQSLGHIIYYLPPLLTLVTVLTDFRSSVDSPYRRDAQYWLALALGGFAYAMINNGWLYTFYPVNALVLVCAFYIWRHFRWLAANEPVAQKAKKARAGANACVLAFSANMLFVVVAVSVFMVSTNHSVTTDPHRLCAEGLGKELKKYDAHTYGNLSLSSTPWPILFREHNARLVTRYAHLWMMPKLLLKNADNQNYAWIQNVAANNIAADITKNTPEMLFEQVVQYNEATLPLGALLAGVAPFDKVFSEYKQVAEIIMDKTEEGPPTIKQCHFRIYKRKNSG